jgi:hypothetical protein
MEEPKEKTSLARIALIVGIIAGIGAVIGVGWQILHHDDTSVADYQKVVAGTCEQAHAILVRDRSGEFLVFDVGQPGEPASPADLYRVRKDALLRVMDDNVTQVHVAFDGLDSHPRPGALDSPYRLARSAQDAWFTAQGDLRAAVEERLPSNAKGSRLEAIASAFLPDTTGPALDSAMTQLAGATCKVTK